MTYDEFRSGLTYQDVWRMLWVDTPDRNQWVQKSPGVILRHWHGLKQAMWDEFFARGIDPATLPAPPRPKRRSKTRPLALVAGCRPDASPPPKHAPTVRPGRIPVRKEILHMGRRFFVTYWHKAPKAAA